MVDVARAGWIGVDRESAEVQRLQKHLAENNGIKGIDVCAPDEVERARQLFYRDGFVCVRDALTREQLDFLRKGCAREIQRTLEIDSAGAGNRGSGRFSFDCAGTGNQLHNPEWAALVDLPTVTPIIAAIFGSHDYHVRGARGDFVLPGTLDYQPLHTDITDRQDYKDPSTGKIRPVFSFKDPRGLITNRDLPCFYLACNFLMSDFTRLNGPVRQIPGSQHSHETPPTRRDEPEWMKLSTLCPLPAGSVCIRDVRAWHGGTPNVSDEVRCIPNIEFYAPWFRDVNDTRPCMPREIYETLSEHGKHISRHVLAPDDMQLATAYSAASVRSGSNPFKALSKAKL